LLKRTEEQRALKIERLRTSIRAGDEAIASGDMVVLNSDQELDTFFAKL